uniref:Alkaline ceramidase n=1 Tax=Podarcis muralis TaxID=64176 RepID=A0A670KG11_PODMU|nr:alkaline ceramidase 1 [Podarcis muralis]
MPSIFAYQSAEVDWCEENFAQSEYIAEYYNTISNVGFFILPPIMMFLNPQYIQYRPVPIPGLTIMSTLIGLFSGYFHMTLSYAGQMLDELSILWAIALCYAFWLPVHYYPPFIKNRDQFMWLVGIVTVLSTLMSFVKPTLNAYALNSVALHLLYLSNLEFRKCNNVRVHRLIRTMVVWWCIAITCWLTDKFLCGLCQRANFAYLHSIWHLCIVVTIFYCATTVVYFDVFYELPSSEPDVVYWPSEGSFFSLPYINLPKFKKQC